MLGQSATDAQSNEITAVPKLLKLLRLEGGIVTVDALNCQRDITQQVIDQKGDYVMALKGNQGTLHDDVRTFLEDPQTKLSISASTEDKTSKRGQFAETRIGFVHIDSCELRLTAGRLVMFLAIDRVSKFTVVEFHESAGKMQWAAFLRHLIAAFPYAIHTVLTDNGVAFADLPKNRTRYPEMQALFGGHIFDRICREHGIERKLVKP